jgi:hypothetical protein
VRASGAAWDLRKAQPYECRAVGIAHRKNTFFAFRQRATFHTAWVISGLSRNFSGCRLHLDEQTLVGWPGSRRCATERNRSRGRVLRNPLRLSSCQKESQISAENEASMAIRYVRPGVHIAKVNL